MKILNIGHIDNYARCEKCGTEIQYDKYDLYWTHTEEKHYYVKCPVCNENIWVKSTPELDKMYREAWTEKLKNK